MNRRALFNELAEFSFIAVQKVVDYLDIFSTHNSLPIRNTLSK